MINHFEEEANKLLNSLDAAAHEADAAQDSNAEGPETIRTPDGTPLTVEWLQDAPEGPGDDPDPKVTYLTTYVRKLTFIIKGCTYSVAISAKINHIYSHDISLTMERILTAVEESVVENSNGDPFGPPIVIQLGKNG